MRWLAVVLLLAAAIAAQDKAIRPDTPEQAAGRVVVAFNAGDEKMLRALAAKNDPDPWARRRGVARRPGPRRGGTRLRRRRRGAREERAGGLLSAGGCRARRAKDAGLDRTCPKASSRASLRGGARDPEGHRAAPGFRDGCRLPHAACRRARRAGASRRGRAGLSGCRSHGPAPEAGGFRWDAAENRSYLAAVVRKAGNLDEAVRLGRRSIAEARELGALHSEALALHATAEAELERGRAAEAMALAREAVEPLNLVAHAFAHDMVAAAKQQHAGVFDVGARAAYLLGNVSELAFFLETGRAGALLDAIG